MDMAVVLNELLKGGISHYIAADMAEYSRVSMSIGVQGNELCLT